MKNLMCAFLGLVPQAYDYLSTDTKIMYRKMFFFSMITAFSGAITGIDFAHMFVSSDNTTSMIGGSIGFMLVLYLEHMMLSSHSKKIQSLVPRFIVGLAINTLGVFSLFALVFGGDVASNHNADAKKQVDIISNSYQSAKDDRYKEIINLEELRTKSHSLCAIEERRNGRGPIFERLHKTCLDYTNQITEKKAELDEQEKPFKDQYLAEKNRLEQPLTFAERYVKLFELIKSSWVYQLIAGVLGIIAIVIDFGSMSVKYASFQNLEYDDESEKYKIKEKEDIEHVKRVLEVKDSTQKVIDIGILTTETIGKLEGCGNLMTYVENGMQNSASTQLVLSPHVELLKQSLAHCSSKLSELYSNYGLNIANSQQSGFSVGNIEQNNLNFKDESEHTDASLKSLNTFLAMNKPMKDISDSLFAKSNQNEIYFCKLVFDYMQANFTYVKKDKSYASPLHTFNFKQGVCGETAMLFVVLVRRHGVNAKFCEVIRDYKGELVNHACVIVTLKNGKQVLIDPVAYNLFDVKHKEYKTIDDFTVLQWFRYWQTK